MTAVATLSLSRFLLYAKSQIYVVSNVASVESTRHERDGEKKSFEWYKSKWCSKDTSIPNLFHLLRIHQSDWWYWFYPLTFDKYGIALMYVSLAGKKMCFKTNKLLREFGIVVNIFRRTVEDSRQNKSQKSRQERTYIWEFLNRFNHLSIESLNL